MARDDSFLPQTKSNSQYEALAGSATLVSDGENIARANLSLIENAEREVISLEFLLRDDEFGMMKMALLRRKAREGKRVIVHVDSFHLMVDPSVIWNLMNEGIEFTIFNKLTLKSFPKMSYRNHSKGLIVDQSIFKTGDSNTGDEYVHWEPNGFRMKSLDVIIEGPVAAEARKYAFALMTSPLAQAPQFKITSQAEVEEQRKQIRTLIKLTKLFFRTLFVQMDAPEHIARPQCIYLTQDEVDRARQKLDEAESRYDAYKAKAPLHSWKQSTACPFSMKFYCDPIENKSLCPGVNAAVLNFINGAEKQLSIVSPYLIFTNDMKQAIDQALKRGVHIHFYTNSLKSTDNHTTQMAYEYRFQEMARSGTFSNEGLGALQISEYQGPETLHAKFMVRDQSSSMIMTYNIDWRSESKNLETAVEFDCPLLSEALRTWISNHQQQFSLVANQGKVHKMLVEPTTAADLVKKLVILSIEKHL